MKITVLGSDPGESVIVEFLDGSVITVDCCKVGGINYTIGQLTEMGISGDRVTHNVFTHFHSDHIRGSDELVKYCPKSKIVFPDYWGSEEFKRFVASFDPSIVFAKIDATREVTKLFNLAAADKSRVQWAIEAVTLFPPLSHGGTATERMVALSPLSLRKTEFSLGLGAALADSTASALTFCETNANRTSIAFGIFWEDRAAFLGADLENEPGAEDIDLIHRGQMSHVSSYDLVKLPHHGSKTAFSDTLRSAISDSDTVVVITPKATRAGKLPLKDALTYLRGVLNIHVLVGEIVSEDRAYRVGGLGMVKKIPRYRPGVLEYKNSCAVTLRCKTLGEFLGV